MSLSDYDSRILNFIYDLTRLDRPMSYREISKKIYLDSGKISPKTVERWFGFLKRPYNHLFSRTKHRFDYFPKFYYEKLGLVYVYVISRTKDNRILRFSPLSHYQNYAAWLYDPKLNENVLLTGYLIPLESVKSFESIWKRVLIRGFVKDYEINLIPYSARMIYSPWHKCIDSEGNFSPLKNQDVNREVSRVIDHFSNVSEIKICDEVLSNPLIIPVLFESWAEHKSSHSVWKSLKNKLGKNFRYYLKSDKDISGAGIRKVQETLREVNRSKIVHSMKAIYLPLQLKNFFIYFFIDFKDKIELNEILLNLARNSIQSTVNVDLDRGKLFCVNLVGNKSLPEIFDFLGNFNVKRLLFLQHEKSLPLLTNKNLKFNYNSLFNPETFEWKKL